MSDTPIFSGNVFVEDANPPLADYTPARKVNVNIAFTATNETELATYTGLAGTLARDKVDELLGRKPAAATPAAEATKTATKTKATKTKDTPAAESPEVLAERARLAAELDVGTGGEPAAGDGVDLSEFDVQPETTANDDLDLTTAAPSEVTDADLNAAVQKKNTEITNPEAIRGLIATYNPDPTRVFQLREVPQAQRAGFLAKLAELKKAA